MHRIYHTDALVFGVRSAGEGSAVARLYTRELGLLSGWVQGARGMPSKLRYHLQPFSHCTVSLVRGRDVWRVVGAEESPASLRVKDKTAGLPIIARVMAALSRMLAGEERDQQLYDDFIAGISAFASAPNEHFSSVETALLLRTLHRLGYVAHDEMLAPVLEAESYESLQMLSPELRVRCIERINTAFRESHL